MCRGCVVLFACLAFVVASPAMALTVTVDSAGGGDFTSIQDGIDGVSFGDTVLVMPGEYVECIAMGPSANGVSLLGAAAAESTIISMPDGAIIEPLLKLEGVGSSTCISRLTLTTVRGSASRPAIACYDSDALITGNIIRDSLGGCHMAPCAGGMHVYSGSPQVVGNTFSDNQSADGGAMHIEGGSPLVHGNLFVRNVGWGFGGTNSGGAICIWNGNPVITENTFRDNEASRGGAIYSDGWFVRIERNIFDHNWAESTGAAAYVDCAEGVVFADNAIIGNTDYNIGCCVLGVSAGSQTGTGSFERNVFWGNDTGGEPSIELYGERLSESVFRHNFFGDDSTCLVAAPECAGAGTLNFADNWWGTTEESEIAARVLDVDDDPDLCRILYSPWCGDPSCAGSATTVPEAIQEISWGRLKSIYR